MRCIARALSLSLSHTLSLRKHQETQYVPTDETQPNPTKLQIEEEAERWERIGREADRSSSGPRRTFMMYACISVVCKSPARLFACLGFGRLGELSGDYTIRTPPPPLLSLPSPVPRRRRGSFMCITYLGTHVYAE
jgi:hypothetical protein